MACLSYDSRYWALPHLYTDDSRLSWSIMIPAHWSSGARLIKTSISKPFSQRKFYWSDFDDHPDPFYDASLLPWLTIVRLSTATAKHGFLFGIILLHSGILKHPPHQLPQYSFYQCSNWEGCGRGRTGAVNSDFQRGDLLLNGHNRRIN